MIDIDRVILADNLIWSWRKARRLYQSGDAVHDQGEVAAFDLNLEAELRSIADDLASGRYVCAPLRVLPQPKRADEEGVPQMREAFLPKVRDQVAWIAVVNAIGPALDAIMPSWSYANRLYRAVWYERDETEGAERHLMVGPYRHSPGHLYRRFKHSWPLFRRHLSLSAQTAVAQAGIDETRLDDTDRAAWLIGRSPEGRIPYLASDWWRRKAVGKDLYHCTFDLERFYPNLTGTNVMTGISKSPEISGGLLVLIESMLQFETDLTHAPGLLDALDAVPASSYDRVPTGLFVAGFLSNVAMLPVDLDVVRELEERRDLAHFRYVDDHAVLAESFEAMLEWISSYEALLLRHGIAARIAPGKYDPEGVGNSLAQFSNNPEGAGADPVAKECRIDGAKPTKLATRTLALVSNLATVDADILADLPRAAHLEQLRWLLLANIPDAEIRGATRASFAAGKLAAMTAGHHDVGAGLVSVLRDLATSTGARSAPDGDLNARLIRERKKDEDARRRLLESHFELLMDAAAAHPDKPRLFQRILDYCRQTGHPGLEAVSRWIASLADGPEGVRSARYFAALGLGTVSRLLVGAAQAAGDARLLHRERDAAISFVKAALRVSSRRFGGRSGRGDAFERTARTAFGVAAFLAALRLEEGADQLSRTAGSRSKPRVTELGRFASRCRRKAVAELKFDPALTPAAWRENTGYSLGEWIHLGESFAPSGPEVPVWWEGAVASLDLGYAADRNALRRYPAAVGADYLSQIEGTLLEDDAGWLRDAVAAHSDILANLGAPGAEPFRSVAAVSAFQDGTRSLYEWVGEMSVKQADDPRRGEWTALEIMLRLLTPDPGGRGPQQVASLLHPSNVRVPLTWFDDAKEQSGMNHLTWEGWRAIVNSGEPKIAGSVLRDYRYADTGEESFVAPVSVQLSAVGRLLWGLLRLDFSLPPAWNVRGQERALAGALFADLESMTVSSGTAKLLRACITPRGRENILMLTNREMFSDLGEANDMQFELTLKSLEDVRVELATIQRDLRACQVTVLDHRPRQLVPVRIQEAALSASVAESDW